MPPLATQMATTTILADQRAVGMQDMGQSHGPHVLKTLPDPNVILTECQDIGIAIKEIISRLKPLEASDREEEAAIFADAINDFHQLVRRINRLKSQPGSRDLKNKAQVDRLGRLIREAVVTYQQSESKFRRNIEDRKRGQFRIVKPDATEDEVKEVISGGLDTQIFQQALLNSSRRSEALGVLSNARQRRAAIEQIERAISELQEIFQDLDTVVVEQEPMVQELEQRTTDTQQAMERGNVHLDGAIAKARAARKRKWICLGVCVFALFVVVVVVLVWSALTGRFVSRHSFIT